MMLVVIILIFFWMATGAGAFISLLFALSGSAKGKDAFVKFLFAFLITWVILGFIRNSGIPLL